MSPLRLGTRASALAQWQAQWVAARLGDNGVEVQLVPITTTGDRRLGTIAAIGGEGVFTKEIQRALLDRRIDLAVHSFKDLPTGTTPGLALAAVPERGPVADVLAVRGQGSEVRGQGSGTQELDPLSPGAIIGTGSLRRRAQLLHVRRDLVMKDVRGNVETRLHKLDRGDFDALILAEAGLRRLGLGQHIAEVLPAEIMLSAVGQGALALETRDDDHATRQFVAGLDHGPTHVAVLAERAMLAALRGGCLAPVAGWGRITEDRLTLTGRVISHDGGKLLEATETIDMLPGGENYNHAEQLGRKVAEDLLAQGVPN